MVETKKTREELEFIIDKAKKIAACYEGCDSCVKSALHRNGYYKALGQLKKLNREENATK